MDVVVTLPELPASIDARFLESALVGRDVEVAIGETRSDCRVVTVSVSGAGRVSLTIRLTEELLRLMAHPS